MILLEKPYVSDFLIETIRKNNFSVLDNEVAREYFSAAELTSKEEAIEKYKNENELFYANSENAISFIFENLKNTKLDKMINLSKDKAAFREALKNLYPKYYFKKVDFSSLKNINPEKIPYPVILKPNVGFLSFGVYPIISKEVWEKTILKLEEDIKKFENIFPKNVVNTADFIIEEMIEGDEFALDAYFDKNGEATILNIYQHPFFDGDDVSDRVYFTSKKIIQKYHDKFKKLLDDLAKSLDFKDFPFHLELRANEKNIIPIEINPLRFCGWCITDLAYFSWGINVYEAYFNQTKPNWDEILSKKDDDFYYFTIADIPNNIDRSKIKEINFEKYLKNIKNPLEIRKIDYSKNPIFAITFAKTPTMEEIKFLLGDDTGKYIS